MSRLLLVAALALAGCLSPGASEPASTWEFTAPAEASDVRVRVILPASLRRPTLVTRDGDRMVNHDMDRWGTPLSASIAREVAEDLAALPVQDVVVDVQRLDVTADGKVTLLFTAQMTLEHGPNGGGTPLRVRSELIEHSIRLADAAPHPLSAAFAGYGTASRLISEPIRRAVAQEQGGVAKPPASVTVPGQ